MGGGHVGARSPSTCRSRALPYVLVIRPDLLICVESDVVCDVIRPREGELRSIGVRVSLFVVVVSRVSDVVVGNAGKCGPLIVVGGRLDGQGGLS